MARGSVDLGIVSKFDNKGVSKAQKSFKKFGGVAAGVATAAVAAIAGIGTAAARMASEFETSFAKIEGLVGVSKGEIETLSAAAQELGPQFGKSAQEAADALFFITSAGLRGAEATEVLEASLKASAAGLGAVEPIANAATAAMNTYGSETLSGTAAVDALTEAVRLGQLAPAELSSALGKVIPIANELGVSFEETTGLVAGLTRGGLSASEAVTGIRGAMQAVLKPTGESADMLEQYGFSAAGVKESIEKDGLLATFGSLREAFGENEEDFTRLIGSQEGLNAVLAMTGEASEDYRDIVSQMTDDMGALDEAFGAVEETAGFKFDRAMETAKAALLPLGETLLDIGSQLLEGLMPVIDSLGPVLTETFSHLQEPLMELAGLLPVLLDAFLPLLPIVGELVGFIADLAVALMPSFVQLIELLTPILELLMPVLDVVVGLFEILLVPLETLLTILTPLVETILTPITTAFSLLSDGVGYFADALQPVNDVFMPAFTDHLREHFQPMIDASKEVLREMVDDGLQYLVDQGIIPAGSAMELFSQNQPVLMMAFANATIDSINMVIKGFNLLMDGLQALHDFHKKVFGAMGVDVSHMDASFEEIPEIPRMTRFDFMTFPEVETGALVEEQRFSGRMEEMIRQRNEAAEEAFGKVVKQKRSELGPLSPEDFSGFRPMADGGIVTGPTFALIGEAGPEAVIPLKDSSYGGGNYNITVNAGVGDPVRIGEEVVTAIKRYERVSGPVFASA